MKRRAGQRRAGQGRAGRNRSDDSSRAGFSLIELLIATTILAILAGIAYASLKGTRKKRLVTEVVNSLPALKSFENVWWERTGGYVFSSDWSDPDIYDIDDAVTFNVASWDRCEQRQTSGTLQAATDERWTPDGCQWDYVVYADRCAADCSPAGDACAGDLNCFCAVARPRSGGAGSNVVQAMIGDHYFCIEDTGRQLTTMPQADGAPLGWN